MAEKGKNFLKGVVVEMNRVLKFMAAKIQDTEAKKAMLKSLGLDPSGATVSPAIPAASMQSIQAYSDKSDDDVDMEAFASVVTDIISVSNAIDSFINMVSNDDPEIANEFFDMMMHLYLLESMRLRANTKGAKALHTISKAIYFYEELAVESGGLVNFTGSIFKFLGKLYDGANADNEEEAKQTTDTVFLAIAVLSYLVEFVREHIKIQYGFDSSPGSSSPNADRLTERTITLSLTFTAEDESGNELEAASNISLALKPKDQGGKELMVFTSGEGKLERKFGDFKFSFELEGAPEPKTTFAIEKEEFQPLFIGSPKTNHLKLGLPKFEFIATAADNNIKIQLSTKDSAFLLAQGDGFISSFFPEKGIYGNFDLGVGLDLKEGNLYLAGGSGLSVFIPLHVNIKDVLIFNSVFIKLAARETKDGTDLETSIGFTLKFLAFTATVERIGILHQWVKRDNKRKYEIGFKPPNGVGLAFDGGILKGGGFLYFDNDKGEYFGALELAFINWFTLKAIGVITTKMPDGSKGFSMLLILTFEFPIHLSFGFILAGVGGLVGVNRTVKIDLLREGVKTNAVKSVLFPQDVVANMSRIISDLRTLFPPKNDVFLCMPMFKLSWGTSDLISIEVGLLFGGGLEGFAILGVFKIVMPHEKTGLIQLQVNFLGVVDFENEYISFDASLYDSRLLVFTLEGDMAFRLSWGVNPMFIVSAGGFHPAFKEAPGDLANMKRMTISLLSGENPRITLKNYFAVTSNTAQFGARAELYAAAFGFNIYGFIGYDVLFQFDPFKFIADFSAGVALRRGSSVIMGISVFGVLSGPKPIDVKGEASFSLLFLERTIPIHVTFGGDPDPISSVEEDIIKRLKEDITGDQAWKADIPDNNSLYVTIREIKKSLNLVIHPFGVLTFSERSVPLGTTLNRFGNNKIKGEVKIFEIKPADAGLSSEAVTEQFAPANFFNLKDDEKLARPSFEQMKSGFKITGSSITKVPSMITKSVDYELTYLRKKKHRLLFAGIYKYSKTLFRAGMKGGSVARSGLSSSFKKASSNAPEQPKLQKEGFAIANTSDLKLYSSSAQRGSYMEASELINDIVRNNPSMKGKLQVVSTHELNQ